MLGDFEAKRLPVQSGVLSLNGRQGYALIPQLTGYTVSDQGEILNPRGRPLRQWQDSPNGPFRVKAGGRNRMVSYLVLTAFTGVPPGTGYSVRYRNGDRSDSRLENLMWGGKPKGGPLWGFIAKSAQLATHGASSALRSLRGS